MVQPHGRQTGMGAEHTLHAIEPNAVIPHIPVGRPDLPVNRAATLDLLHTGNKEVPLVDKLQDVRVRDGLNGADALWREHVSLRAPLALMLGALSAGEDVRHRKTGEHIVPVCLEKTAPVPVDHRQSTRVRDRDVVRGKADEIP